MILEPIRTEGWARLAYHVPDADILQKVCKSNRDLDVFVDEAGETLLRDSEYQFLATRSRQYGHRLFFIAQRAQQVLPIIRNNCEAVYCFRQSKPDAEILAREYADPVFLSACTLKKGEYLARLGIDSPVKKYQIFSKPARH